MDKFIEGLAAVLQPPWNYVAGVAALIVLNLNSFIEFRDRWRSSHTETKKLEQEKLRLEVLLLRQQVLDARIQSYVPEITPEIAFEVGPIRIDPRSSVADVIAPPSPPQPAPAPVSYGAVRRFVMNHPAAGSALMWAAQISCFPLIAMFGLATPGIVIAGYSDPDLGLGISFVLALIYAALAGLAYWGFRAAGSIRRAAAA